MARTRIRSSAIIIKNKKILLIHRKKNGDEYWVFPGGGIEEGENGEKAVEREIKEETNLICKQVKFAFEIETFEGGNKHPFYFCDVSDEELKLGGPELIKQSNDDWYNPEWVNLDLVSDIILLPETAKQKLLEIVSS